MGPRNSFLTQGWVALCRTGHRHPWAGSQQAASTEEREPEPFLLFPMGTMHPEVTQPPPATALPRG